MDERTSLLLDKLLVLSPLEKNLLYHQILPLLRQTNSPEQTTSLIIQEVLIFLSNKKYQLEELSDTTAPIPVGKIFRRVG